MRDLEGSRRADVARLVIAEGAHFPDARRDLPAGWRSTRCIAMIRRLASDRGRARRDLVRLRSCGSRMLMLAPGLAATAWNGLVRHPRAGRHRRGLRRLGRSGVQGLRRRAAASFAAATRRLCSRSVTAPAARPSEPLRQPSRTTSGQYVEPLQVLGQAEADLVERAVLADRGKHARTQPRVGVGEGAHDVGRGRPTGPGAGP